MVGSVAPAVRCRCGPETGERDAIARDYVDPTGSVLLHLAAGLTAGLVVFVMLATGVVLVFQSQMTAFIDRVVRTVRPVANQPRLVTRAEEVAPQWRSLVMRWSDRAGAPVSVSFSGVSTCHAFVRSQVTLNATTGDVIIWQPYDSSSLGQRLRQWVRFAHTGELGDWMGQTLAALACVGAMMLVWTGIVARCATTDEGRHAGQRARGASTRDA